MKLLVAFLLGLFAYSALTADRPLRPRPLVLVGICAVLSAGYLMRRFV
jgi:hypothetical protein